MDAFTWVLSILLGVAFLGAGVLKLLRSRTQLIESGMGWACDFSQGRIRGIGVLELLGRSACCSRRCSACLTASRRSPPAAWR